MYPNLSFISCLNANFLLFVPIKGSRLFTIAMCVHLVHLTAGADLLSKITFLGCIAIRNVGWYIDIALCNRRSSPAQRKRRISKGKVLQFIIDQFIIKITTINK